MLASLIIIPLYFVILIYLLADWDSLSGPLLVSWTSINFLGLVIFFYLLLRWVNQRLVAAISRRTHSAKGRWFPPPSVPASPSELGRRRVPLGLPYTWLTPTHESVQRFALQFFSMMTCRSCTAEDCWKDEHLASKTNKPARCRLWGTLVNSQQVDIENIANSLPKIKYPAGLDQRGTK